MTKAELLAKIELLNQFELMIKELESQANAIRNTLKDEMVAKNAEEITVGRYVLRYSTVLSNRFDSTAFKKVLPDLYKAYTKQVSSHRFTIC